MVIERANGKCEACGAPLKPGGFELDHIIPASLGGKPDAANAMCMCRACHVAKSGQDIKRVRKADRQRDKSSGAIKPKGSIPSRPKAERTGKPSLPPRRMYEGDQA